MDAKFSPVVAWDVDGVTRLRTFSDGDNSHVFTREITFHKDQYPNTFHRSPYWEEDGTSTSMNSFSILGKQLMQEVTAMSNVESVFATTWQKWANFYFAEHLEIPSLPVAVKTLEPLEANYFHCSPAWKTSQLAQQFNGRPLIFIDDNMPDRPDEELDHLRNVEDRYITMSYKINPYSGITSRDYDEIMTWISQASTPEGHAQLRNERLTKLQSINAYRLQREKAKKKQKEVQQRSFEIMEELFPRQEYLNRSVSLLVSSYRVFTAKMLSSAFLRHNKKHEDINSIYEKLFIPGYHEEDIDEDLYDF